MELCECVFCNQVVTGRQHALLCDNCGRWQHRKCETGMSQAVYRGLAIVESFQIPSSVIRIVQDFEISMWQAVKEVLPQVTIRGCSFHWGQAVWKHVQTSGLQTSYKKDLSTKTFVKKILSLPYLPVEKIHRLFIKLRSEAEKSPTFLAVYKYVKDTWIDGTWTPRDWCVFDTEVRTNNDVEGWHNRLNRRASKAGMNFYALLQLLHSESKRASLDAELVKRKAIRRYQRKATTNRNAELFCMWESYKVGTITAEELFKKLTKLSLTKLQ